MYNFIIKSNGSEVNLIADDVCWSGNGLKFLSKDKVIAVFMVWDYWYEIINL